MITQGGNQLCTLANSKKIYEALKHENLQLHVVMDLFPTPTGLLADYLLPAADCLERPDISSKFGLVNYFMCGEQAVEPQYERKNDYYLWAELGRRLGQEQFWPENLEGMLDRFVAPTGKSFGEMARSERRWIFTKVKDYKKYERLGFATNSGKVELLPSVFEELGYNPLPEYNPTEDIEAGEDKYPFLATAGGRVKFFTHSTLRQVDILRRRYPYPRVKINPETADKLGINHGDWVRIERPEGSIVQVAHVDPGVRPEVVHIDSFWWYPEKDKDTLFGFWDSCVSVMIPDGDAACDYAGNHLFRGFRCNLQKAM